VSENLLKCDSIGWVHEDSSEKIFSLQVGSLPWERLPKTVAESPDLGLGICLVTCIEGCPSIEQLIDNDSHAPNVHAVIVSDFTLLEARCEHLNRVELQGTHTSILTLSLELLLKDSKAEVCYVHTPIEAHHDVLRLQVSVYDSFLVNLLECVGELVADFLSMAFLGRLLIWARILVKISMVIVGENYTEGLVVS
jgi:hypothetical protein